MTVNWDVDPIFFTDDNSGSASFQEPYSNQNHTITLCPDAPGQALSLAFLVFSLETGVAAADNDVLYIYDGDNTSAPLVGTGEDNSLANVTITASDVNLTGCITIEFVVNSGAFAGNQGWVAQVTCETHALIPTQPLRLRVRLRCRRSRNRGVVHRGRGDIGWKWLASRKCWHRA